MILAGSGYPEELKTIHVYVALCDNEHQNIVPVPAFLGDGKDPDNNLYWGAGGGTKTFIRRSENWDMIDSMDKPEENILERVIFKYKYEQVYLLADAYDGEKIKNCLQDFFQACSGSVTDTVNIANQPVLFGGASDLVVYIGHDGLMDFDLGIEIKADTTHTEIEAIMLSCISKKYFAEKLRKTGAFPLLWTTGLMAPEAYTLKAALEGWIKHETGDQIKERAAQAYNKYQNCGIGGARKLFHTGW